MTEMKATIRDTAENVWITGGGRDKEKNRKGKSKRSGIGMWCLHGVMRRRRK